MRHGAAGQRQAGVQKRSSDNGKAGMKHHPSIVKKIRKLMRLSKAPGPEGERAAERARELMQRHEIDEVSLDQRILVEVPGVDGEMWREQVLLAVVQAAGVELLQNTSGEKKRAALRGERADVMAALSAYHRVTLDISRRCLEQADVSLPGCPKGHIARKVWSFVFHMGASTSLGESVADALKKARAKRNGQGLGTPEGDGPDMTPPPKQELAQEVKDRSADEFEEMFVDLIQRIGLEKAELVREIAFRMGVARGKELTLVERPALPQQGHVPLIDQPWGRLHLPSGTEIEIYGDPSIAYQFKSKVV